MNARVGHFSLVLFATSALLYTTLLLFGIQVPGTLEATVQANTLPPPYLDETTSADAPYGPTPQLDGAISPGEYAGAYRLTFPTYGGDMEMFIRQDAITLYLALDSPDTALFPTPANGPAFQVFLDTKHNGGTAPQADDYRLTLGKDGITQENRGDGSSWGGAGDGHWLAQASTSPYGWQGEFAINLAKLGITQTGAISIGLAVAEVWTPVWPKDWYWPATGDWLNPSTWGNLTSSSYWSTFYWKPGPWADYAPSGVPDFDQRQGVWQRNGVWTHCGPVAAANSLWWFDSKFETPDHMPPTISDTYGLITSYGGAWDDHDVPNVMPLVDDLANNYFGTNQGLTGTSVISMFYGMNNYLHAHNLWDDYRVTLVVSPTFEWVATEVQHSEDVILLLGFYQWILDPDGTFRWARVGGHYVTVSGVDSVTGQIALSDPALDMQELAPSPFGRVLSGTLIPHQPIPGHPSFVHNDAGNISHDAYPIGPSNSPGGIWGLPTYPVYELEQLLGSNPHPTIPTEPLQPGPPPQVEVEFALAVSPYMWKASGYTDYSPNGMPDFDQQQDNWHNLLGQWSYCGPVAAANSVWWFDSKFEPQPITPPTVNDHYPLISTYATMPPFWDDHDPLNVESGGTELIDDLAQRFQTDVLGSGTIVTDVYTGLDQYLIDHNLRSGYVITLVQSPAFWWVAEEVERSEDVILLLGFYFAGGTSIDRVGGHYVTLAGVDKAAGLIAFSDPTFDHAEKYWPFALTGVPSRQGRVANGSLLAHVPVPGHPNVTHNDAGNLSHDIYAVGPFGPGGTWGPIGYVQTTSEITNFIGQNGGGIPVPPVPQPIETRVEWAVAVSPVADVGLVKAITPTLVQYGDHVTFTLIFSNAGSLPAQDVVIADTLPAELINTAWSASLPITPILGAAYAWQLPDLAWGQGGTITITGQINATAARLTVTNTAVITTSSVEQYQLPALPNRSSAAFTIVNPLIAVTPSHIVITLMTGSSATQAITVSNNGGATLLWNTLEVLPVDWLAAAPTNGSVLPGLTDSITVTFDATGLYSHTYTTTLRFMHNVPQQLPIDVPITLIVPPPAIDVAPAQISLTLTTSVTATHWITVANVGQSALNWSAAEIPGVTWLSESPGSGSLAPNTKTPLTVTFSTSGLNGFYTTTLRFTSDDPVHPQIDVPITLTVLAPSITVTPVNLAITLTAGLTTTRSITVANLGQAPLNWSATEVPAVAWLSAVPLTGAVAPSGQQLITASLTANALSGGAYTTTLRFTSDDPDHPQIDVPIMLTVLAPSITVTPVNLAMTLTAGLTTTRSITVANLGQVPLNWSVTEVPAVAWLSAVPLTGAVAPSGQQLITASLTANALSGGAYTTTLRFTSDDPGHPQIDVPITLTVLAPYLEVTPTTIVLTLATGLSATQGLTITNSGSANLTWNIALMPTVAWLTIAPSGGALAPGVSATSVMTFDTSGLSGGVYTTTLRLTSDDPDRPQIDVPITLNIPLGYSLYLPVVTRNF